MEGWYHVDALDALGVLLLRMGVCMCVHTEAFCFVVSGDRCKRRRRKKTMGEEGVVLFRLLDFAHTTSSFSHPSPTHRHKLVV